MKQAREEQFYERQHAYMLERFGVGYSLSASILSVQDTSAYYSAVWQALPQYAGSSRMYLTMVYVKAASVGFALTSSEDTALRDAIAATAAETLLFLDYQTTVFNSLPLYDDLTGTGRSAARNLISTYPKAFSDNTHADCVGPSISGIYIRDPEALVQKIKDEFIQYRAIAEPIYQNLLPDYLGWNNTWIHVFFGTESGVTELGFHAPTDCPNNAYSDPAWGYVQQETLYSTNSFNMQMGGLHADVAPPRTYLGNAYGGCQNSRGTVFVDGKIGNWIHQGGVFSLLAPLQPKDSVYSSIVHEEMHVHQSTRGFMACEDCYFYTSQLAPTAANYVDLISAVEGGATYVDRNTSIQDTTMVVPGSLKQAAFSLKHILLYSISPAAYAGISTGFLTPNEWANFVESNHWNPSGSVSSTESTFQYYSEVAVPSNIGLAYKAGSERHEILRQRVLDVCGSGENNKYLKKVRDANLVMPIMPLLAVEAVIDQYVASGYTEWIYEEGF